MSDKPVAMYRENCADGSRCLHGCHTNEPCHTRPQPKAEQDKPVAWFWFDERDGGEWIHIADNQIDANKFGDVKIIPLYTHPQPRKPLTDEQIDAYLESEWTGYSSYHDCFKEIVRWAEAKHDIKE